MTKTLGKAPILGASCFYSEPTADGRKLRAAIITEVLQDYQVSLFVMSPTGARSLVNVEHGNKAAEWCYHGEYGV